MLRRALSQRPKSRSALPWAVPPGHDSSVGASHAEDPTTLLIVSIFAPSPWNREWYSLQSGYIAATTKDCAYDHELFLNGVAESELSAHATLLGSSSESLDHATALRQTVGALRQRTHDYFLLLDSDCFPIAPNWFTILRGQMERFGKKIAAPIRFENLDRMPHPCAFFLTRAALHDERINFDKGSRAPNLLGKDTADVGNAMLDLMPLLLPLLRTNIVNPHPVAAAVYDHLFYHHGAGSRNSRFRVLHKYGYHAHWWDHERESRYVDELRKSLFEDPVSFVDYLLGRNHDWRQEWAALRREGQPEPSPRGQRL
jgi:hypothetical protein